MSSDALWENTSPGGALVEVQFRIELVQILNWGGYQGLHCMPVGHHGTAILGPTGMGKSTILDAMAAVIMPNPQEFNRAARDDGGRKAERTVYSYARGKTDDVKDAGTESTTTHFLRPLGSAFPSGAAITWKSDLGERVTAVRVAWITPDTSTQDEVNGTTMYMLVYAPFPLERFKEVKPARGSRSPLGEHALKALVESSRDLVTSSQPTLRARLCQKLGIGGSEESQLKALTLLRRAQASKGIFSINGLFKEFVLTEPLALTRWETTLSAYREASALYDVFEAARKRLEILKDVPAHAERHSTAMASATEKRKLYNATTDQPHTRFDVWHADKIREWVASQIEQNRVDRAHADQQRQTAGDEARAANQAWETAASQVVALGGDRSKLVKTHLEAAQAAHEHVEADRNQFASELTTVGLDLPHSAEDMGILRELIGQQQADIRRHEKDDKEQTQQLAAKVVDLKKTLSRLERDIESYRRRRSNVPSDADNRRRLIATGAGISVDRMRYIGELVEVDHRHRDWTTAIERVLDGIATHLVVDSADFAAARRFVDQNDMRGQVILVPARSGMTPTRSPIPDTVPAMLRYDIDSPFYGWLRDELVEDRSVLCVDSADDLDAPSPSGVKGAVTRAGLRTAARRRVVKDDRRNRTSWIGLDNSARIAALTAERESARRTLDVATGAYDSHQQSTDRRRREADLLGRLLQVEWRSIDIEPHLARIQSLQEELEQFAKDEPEISELGKQMEFHAEVRAKAQAREETYKERVATLDTDWGHLVEAEDQVKDVLEVAVPLTHDERGYLAQLPFAAPRDWRDIEGSRRQAIDALKEQVGHHDQEVDQAEQLLVKIFERYLDFDDAAEIDASIASLPAVLAIHRTLTEDDLPRAKANWLAKAGATMTESLRSLLTQIQDDAHVIRRGIRPINDVLRGIEFREGSTLEIEAHHQDNGDLRDFKKTLTRHTRGTLGADHADEDTTEKEFLALRRDLARLDEKTRAGQAWRHRVLDAREHVQFRAIETCQDGTQIVHDGVSGKSGGEGQELIAFVLGAALRYRLGEGTDKLPTYAPIVLDEGFVKADTDYTGRALAALRELGFQLVIGAPRDKVTAFEEYVDTVAYINRDPSREKAVRIYSLTIEEAVTLDRLGIEPGESR